LPSITMSFSAMVPPPAGRDATVEHRFVRRQTTYQKYTIVPAADSGEPDVLW
jgi:hypothetical protein